MIKPIIGKGHVITHRGLEPSRKNFYSESSLEAFASQLSRGFGGIEFDPNVTSDGIIVMHDATLARLTAGKDSRPVSEISTSEVTNIPLSKGTIPTFEQVLDLVKKSRGSINSLHLKADFQTTKMLAKIIETLASY